MQKGAASLDRLDEVLRAELELEEPEQPRAFRFDEGIRFRDVTFGYAGASAPALDAFSLEVAKGETVALVGASGSGKTTVARLLLRLTDPASGSVEVDGVDVRHLSSGDLRRHIGFVTQDPLLFHDSVEANIALFDPVPDVARIRQVADIANATPFIEALPEGWRRPLATAVGGCLGDSANGWPSPGPSTTTRQFSSSMRRPAPSMPRGSASSRRPSNASWRAGPPWSSRTACPPSGGPTASWSCPKGGSWRPAPMRSSWSAKGPTTAW